MELRNVSPFSPFIFESMDEPDQPIHCVLCRGTFALRPDGTLAIAPVQEPVVLADRWRGSPLASSVE